MNKSFMLLTVLFAISSGANASRIQYVDYVSPGEAVQKLVPASPDQHTPLGKPMGPPPPPPESAPAIHPDIPHQEHQGNDMDTDDNSDEDVHSHDVSSPPVQGT